MKRRRVPPISSGWAGDGSASASGSDSEAEAKSEMVGPRGAAFDHGEVGQHAASSPRKFGLDFILNDRVPLDACDKALRVALCTTASTIATSAYAPAAAGDDGDASLPLTRQLARTCSIDDAEEVEEIKRPSPSARITSQIQSSPSNPNKKRGRTCKADGCDNYIVHKGLCCRHGGGKKCSVDGCESSAKHGGRCWKHGGSVECKIPECTKKTKAKGLCWGHGGGAKCQADACAKVAISNGFCWAHGGGRRCIFDGCQRPAFERTHSFCLRHYDSLQEVDYYEV